MKYKLVVFIPLLYLFYVLFSGCTSSYQTSQYDRRTENEFEAIQGAWYPLTAELAGRVFPEDVRKSIKLVIKDDTYTVTTGENVDEGILKINPAANPKEMDIIGTNGPNKNKTFLAIYEQSGDIMRICYDLSGVNRPKEFVTKEGTLLFLVTYKFHRN